MRSQVHLMHRLRALGCTGFHKVRFVYNDDPVLIEIHARPIGMRRHIAPACSTFAARLTALFCFRYNTKPEIAAEAVALALEAGVRAIDTAAMYENERAVGKAWKTSGLKREEIVLSSKLSNVDLRSGNVRKAVETSLKNLQTDYLDAYYIHSPLASPAQREQAWKDMQAMKKQGIIRACGVSNFGVAKIKQLTGGPGRKPAPDLIQAEISPFNQRRDLVTYAASVEAKVVCAAWSKLSNKETGAQGWGQFAEICGARGMTKAQGLIRWSLRCRNCNCHVSVTDM